MIIDHISISFNKSFNFTLNHNVIYISVPIWIELYAKRILFEWFCEGLFSFNFIHFDSAKLFPLLTFIAHFSKAGERKTFWGGGGVFSRQKVSPRVKPMTPTHGRPRPSFHG